MTPIHLSASRNRAGVKETNLPDKSTMKKKKRRTKLMRPLKNEVIPTSSCRKAVERSLPVASHGLSICLREQPSFQFMSSLIEFRVFATDRPVLPVSRWLYRIRYIKKDFSSLIFLPLFLLLLLPNLPGLEMRSKDGHQKRNGTHTHTQRRDWRCAEVQGCGTMATGTWCRCHSPVVALCEHDACRGRHSEGVRTPDHPTFTPVWHGRKRDKGQRNLPMSSTI